jgi:predicted DNA-binding transcriptional regulator YafY
MMVKKKVSGNKTDRYLSLILEISNTPGWQISEQRLKELLGNPSKSQFYNYLQDLTGDSIDRPAILARIKNEQGFFYKLNEKTWENFFLAQEEGEFLLQAHKKLGYLIENGLHDISFIDSTSNRKNLSRKFIYLSAIQGKAFSEDTKDHLHMIIKSLLGDTKLELSYNKKHYEVFPMSLCQYRDELYLIAFKDSIKQDNLRVFKIIRIQEVFLTKNKFSYPALMKWNPIELFKESSGLLLGERQEAIINVYGHARRIIREKNFFNSKLLEKYKDYDQYECVFTSKEEFVGQLFVYADEIEVLSPSNIKDYFIEKAQRALNINRKIKKAA